MNKRFCIFADTYHVISLMTKQKQYFPPECEYEETIVSGLICTSPEEGGLEGIDYEDLVI